MDSLRKRALPFSVISKQLGQVRVSGQLKVVLQPGHEAA